MLIFGLSPCVLLCVCLPANLCQRRLLITSNRVSNAPQTTDSHHFVTLLPPPSRFSLLPLSYLFYLPPRPNWNSERQTWKCWKSNWGCLGVKHSVVVVRDQVLSSPQSLLSPSPQKWKETLKYFKSSLWIRPTEVGVSGKAFNPSSSEIIKHHCSEEPVGFFKTSSCRLLFPQPRLFFLIHSSFSSFSSYFIQTRTSACLSTWP